MQRCTKIGTTDKDDMQEKILSLISAAMSCTEQWDCSPTIQGTRELYEALEAARWAAKECFHQHDMVEEEALWD